VAHRRPNPHPNHSLASFNKLLTYHQLKKGANEDLSMRLGPSALENHTVDLSTEQPQKKLNCDTLEIVSCGRHVAIPMILLTYQFKILPLETKAGLSI
jgi:hypothetical protein